jgi:N-methylhydantoinase A
VSVERGHDPREFVLVAYGGAGPLHACALAEELGIEAVLVPAAAGVLSALGLAAGEERREHVVSHVRPLHEVGDLPPEGEAELRYRGQSFELTVPLGDDPADRFHRAHEERYGYADREREVELVAVRTAEVVPGPALELPGGEQQHVSGPALLELDGSTVWIPPGWEGARDGPSWVVTRE